MKTILNFLGQIVAQVLVFLMFFTLIGSLAVFAKNSVFTVSKFNWVAGVFLGTIWLIGILVFCFVIWYAMRPSAPPWLRDFILIHKKSGDHAGLAEQFPTASLLAFICAAMLTAVFVLTVVSSVLTEHGLLTYTIESSPEQPMTELLFRLYMWHTIDMIPFIDVWKVYEIKPPIRPENVSAQTIVLVFRTVIIGFAISVIAQWLKFNRDIPGNNKET